jgi:hypothetical protein
MGSHSLAILADRPEVGPCHFFLFNASGELFYAGQFDDTRPRSGLEAHGGDLREAVRRMLDHEEPLARPYPSSGCNIKWKPGNQPEWWDQNKA